MQGKTNNDVLNLMDEFLSPIKMEKAAADDINKTAADNIDEVKKTNSAEPVTPEVGKNDGKAQGSFGAEKQQDVKDGANGAVPADSPAATNTPGGSDKPVDDQGTKSIDSSESVSQSSVTVKDTNDPQEDNSVNNKGETGGHDKQATMRRNAFLAKNINALLQKQAAEKGAPVATPALTEDQIHKLAFQRGVEKRAEDEEELISAGMSPEEASATLDQVADENPVAVLPEEAGAAPELPVELPIEAPPAVTDELAAAEAGAVEAPVEAPVEGETAPGTPEELAAALDEADVSVEELAEAVETVRGLEEAGVSPEEIVAAVQNAGGTAETPVNKVAAARQGVIQKHLGLLKEAK